MDVSEYLEISWGVFENICSNLEVSWRVSDVSRYSSCEELAAPCNKILINQIALSKAY